jgi:dipeptidyl aminopeptidase/acylaminoacyl peptidase
MRARADTHRFRLALPRRRAIATLGAVSMAWASLVALTAGPASASYLGSEGRIAFVRNGDIYSITPAGAGLRLLASGGHDSGPRWSPSGKKLAYVDGGNLWIMNAGGTHKREVTHAAPRFTDGRPTWSPSGRYIAFVRTARHARIGYLTRYDTVTGHFVTFTTTINPPGQIKVPAVPGTAPAWQRAVTGDQFAYFLLYEGAGATCTPGRYCLDALGMPRESQYRNGYPSGEDSTAAPARVTEPDWYPDMPQFATDVLTSMEKCTSTGCTHLGIQLQITSSLILPGAYEAVYSPLGAHIAFVRNSRHGPRIYTEGTSPVVAERPHLLTAGTQPDWQPVAPFPPAAPAGASYRGAEGRIALVRHGDIYSITPAGAGLRLLAGGGHDSGPRWAPSGRQLAYLDRGNLWIMNADGSHKHQVTSGAPRRTDGRPSWSPSGRFLAFIESARHASIGFLTRYDTVSHQVSFFTTTFDHTAPPEKVQSLPGTPVAWQRMASPTPFRYFIVTQGAGDECSASRYCLMGDAISTQAQLTNVYPTAEDDTVAPLKLTDPDWYPVSTQYATDVLASVEHCAAGGCSHSGIMLTITGPVVRPGAYEAVYSPTGGDVAYVRNGPLGAVIYLARVSAGPRRLQPPRRLTTGTEPDWQPVAPPGR